ncbi:DnaJ domain-containing protein [Glomus cerebriforme]|uniref:DnaJ domain-containing protein n=1 Tax=Glomus cerebriforme TaxID=658196 RepID=A0A397SKP2_9GLOM|nr:DnaJ domain-containing protein [Glomus cerebriforme]
MAMAEDHEIFTLVDDLEAYEGEGVNFYSWLGLESTATEKEINRAYRKLSLELHPDKNPDAESKERFALLGAITRILRNPDMRERYNFFLKNGVPRWRGTGYYYNRYRPGLVTVIIGLLALASFLHYVIMWIDYFQEKKRIRHYIKESREIAWGKKMKKQLTKKSVRVNDLTFIVEGDNVYLKNDNGGPYPILDEEKVVQPKITNVMIFVLPRWFYKNIKKQFSNKNPNINGTLVNSGSEKDGFSSDDERSEVGDNLRNKTRRRRGGNKKQNSKLKS